MLTTFAEWLQGTGFSRMVADPLWMIPTLQAIHILCLAVLFSSAVFLSLRLMGVVRDGRSAARLARHFLPWMWYALIGLAITGAMLIVGEPTRSLSNPVFQLKMVMLLVVIVITVCFQQIVCRRAEREQAPRGRTTWIIGASSLVLWTAIAIAGRWIAYV